jgi:hypothetical protein
MPDRTRQTLQSPSAPVDIMGGLRLRVEPLQ